jgi:hypothetical protein
MVETKIILGALEVFPDRPAQAGCAGPRLAVVKS